MTNPRGDMTGRNFAILFASLIAIGVALAIALSHQHPVSIGTPYEIFQAQRAIWLSRRPSDYAVSIDRRCYCPPYSVRVKVSGEKVEHLEFLNGTRSTGDFADRRFYPRDVDSLFQIIDDAYASRAYKIEIIFDDTYGFPIKTSIDRNLDTVDDESAFELVNFEVGHGG